MKNLHKGDVIEADANRRYVVLRKLGEGQFAEVWEVRLSDGSKHDARFALKLEKRKDRSTVKQEYKALKKLSGTCDQVVGVESFGVFDERFYMVLQLLGETLYDARKALGGRCDLPTVKAVGLSTLGAIQQVHQQSLIHRDIKPANFVINPPNSAAGRGSWLLIDFGLARRYTDDSGTHLPPRADASFRGSTTYASVHAHRDEDLSRRDDLWSWLYMMAELLDGGLPWRLDKEEQSHMVDKQWVQQQKEAAIEQPSLLTRTVMLPEAFAAISSHLKGLSFADAPDYTLLRSCLQRLPDHQMPLRELTGPPLPPQQQEQLNGQLADFWQAQQQQQQQAQQANFGQEIDPARQQQQQDLLMTPASPPQEQQASAAAAGAPPPPPSAAATAAAAAAAGNKRARPADAPAAGTGTSEQAAKKQKPESSSTAKKATTGQQQQQQQRQGSFSLQGRSVGSPADDSRPASRPGSASAAAAPAGSARMSGAAGERATAPWQQQEQPRRSDSRSSSRERQQARSRAGRPDSGECRPRQLQRSGSKDSREPAAADGHKASSNARQQQPQQQPQSQLQQRAAAGRQGEIAALLAAFSSEAPESSREAANKAVQGLCSLPPLQAVCAIGMTLDKLVQQSDPGCRLAVAQLLQDLAAYISAGAAKARQQQGHS